MFIALLAQYVLLLYVGNVFNILLSTIPIPSFSVGQGK